MKTLAALGLLILVTACEAQTTRPQTKAFSIKSMRLELLLPQEHWFGSLNREDKGDPHRLEFSLFKDTKGKAISITTERIAPDGDSGASEEKQLEQYLAKTVDSDALQDSNFHKDVIQFLNHRCIRVSGSEKSESMSMPTSSAIFIFIADGLRYQISILCISPEAGPAYDDDEIKSILESLRFLPAGKSN